MKLKITNYVFSATDEINYYYYNYFCYYINIIKILYFFILKFNTHSIKKVLLGSKEFTLLVQPRLKVLIKKFQYHFNKDEFNFRPYH